MPRSHSALRIRARLATVGRKVEHMLNAICVHIARDEALPRATTPPKSKLVRLDSGVASPRGQQRRAADIFVVQQIEFHSFVMHTHDEK
jgi:hypothetical protein